MSQKTIRPFHTFSKTFEILFKSNWLHAAVTGKVGFEKALGAVKVIKDQIQYRSQSLLNLARGYFSALLIGFR